MTSTKQTTVWRESFDGDKITTGAQTRHVTSIVLYDERGPWITNYTNGNYYEFATIRPISLKAFTAPDWDNPNGFIIREHDSYDAQYSGHACYMLFIHLDNIPENARKLLNNWMLYGIGDDKASIQCTFNLGGCTFNRIVGNPRIREAIDGVKIIVEQYGNGCSVFTNYATACGSPYETIAACEHLAQAMRYYVETCERVKNECGVMELIHENKADQPIGPNDWDNIRDRFEFLKNTYRID